LAALQLLNDEPEPFDLGFCLVKGGAFGCERPDHPLQRGYIIWQVARSMFMSTQSTPTRAFPHRAQPC
jgi:hypothetical protein